MLWEHSPGDPGSWHGVTLPAELTEDLSFEAGPRLGFGAVCEVTVRVIDPAG